MLEAKHNRWVQFFFDRYIRRQVQKSFSHYFEVNRLPESDPHKSLLVLPNHISWWDGFFLYPYLHKLTGRKVYLMMLEDQLARYPFFRGLGAFSINPGQPGAALESMQYLARQLQDSRNIGILYPQGEIEPYFKRPANLQKGVNLLFSAAFQKRRQMNLDQKTQVLCAAFCIQYYNQKEPEIWLRWGKLLTDPALCSDSAYLDREFHHNLTLLDQDVIRRQCGKDILKEI